MDIVGFYTAIGVECRYKSLMWPTFEAERRMAIMILTVRTSLGLNGLQAWPSSQVGHIKDLYLTALGHIPTLAAVDHLHR